MLSHEQIGYMKTEDLQFYVSRLEDERRTGLNRGFNVTKIEIEIAYAQREIMHRHVVSANHQEYLKTNPEENEMW